jgi:cytidyltransferase-like protein
MEYKILMTSGCFDLLHWGHVQWLQYLRSRCDVLIVGVSTDRLVKEYKFMSPIIPFAHRINMVRALQCVTYAVSQDEFMDVDLFKKSKAEKFALWSDWKGNKKIPQWYIDNDKMLWIDDTYAISSTNIKEKILRQSYDIIKSQLKRELQK